MQGIRWENLFSIRIWLLGLVTGVLFIAITGLSGGVGVGIMFVVVLLAAFSPTMVLYCPYCRKRVKMGASVCHECGRTVV